MPTEEISFIDEEVFQIYKAIQNTPKLDELSLVFDGNYNVVGVEERLHPLIDDNDVIVVAGAYFGDEGKGKIISAVARHPKVRLIVRPNSGENAGHTVDEYIFHLLPSGMMVPGKINLIGSECVMDPISFLESEIRPLAKLDPSFKERLFVGNVYIVSPYHKLMDLIGNIQTKNISTLKGMSPAHASKVSKRGLRLEDLFNSEDMQTERIRKDLQTYEGLLKVQNISDEQLIDKCNEANEGGKNRIPKHIFDFLQASDKVGFLIATYKEAVTDPNFPERVDSSKMIRDTLNESWKVLSECAQSYWLSIASQQHWRSATAADTTAAGVIAAARYNTAKYKHVVINVHKYPGPSRVGIGANPSGFVPQTFFSGRNIETLEQLAGCCDDFDAIQRKFFDQIQENGILKPITYKDGNGEYTIGAAMAIGSSKIHGECGATTKKPRILGLFDCLHAYETMETQGPYLTISAMDRGDLYDKVGLTIAYVVFVPEHEQYPENLGKKYKTGDIIKIGDLLPTENVLQYCHPIIKVMDGWKADPIAADQRNSDDELPKQVQDFLAAVKYYTGADVISIGNGAKTQDVIYLKETNK